MRKGRSSIFIAYFCESACLGLSLGASKQAEVAERPPRLEKNACFRTPDDPREAPRLIKGVYQAAVITILVDDEGNYSENRDLGTVRLLRLL